MYIKVGPQGSWGTFPGGDGAVGVSLKGGRVGTKVEQVVVHSGLVSVMAHGGQRGVSRLSAKSGQFLVYDIAPGPKYWVF